MVRRFGLKPACPSMISVLSLASLPLYLFSTALSGVITLSSPGQRCTSFLGKVFFSFSPPYGSVVVFSDPVVRHGHHSNHSLSPVLSETVHHFACPCCLLFLCLATHSFTPSHVNLLCNSLEPLSCRFVGIRVEQVRNAVDFFLPP